MHKNENKRECPKCKVTFYCNSSKCSSKRKLKIVTCCFCKDCYLKAFGRDREWREYRESCYRLFNPSTR